MGVFLMKILGFMWPPLGYRLRVAELNRQEREGIAKWCSEVVIPYWTETWPQERLAELERPMFFKKFTTPN